MVTKHIIIKYLSSMQRTLYLYLFFYTSYTLYLFSIAMCTIGAEYQHMDRVSLKNWRKELKEQCSKEKEFWCDKCTWLIITLEKWRSLRLFRTEFHSTGKGELIVSRAIRNKEGKCNGKTCGRASLFVYRGFSARRLLTSFCAHGSASLRNSTICFILRTNSPFFPTHVRKCVCAKRKIRLMQNA